MKTFIYTTQSNYNRRTGSSAVTAQVYRVVKNKPKHVLEVKWNTGSFKGEDSAIMNKLAEAEIIHLRYKQGYYYDWPGKDFDIIGI